MAERARFAEGHEHSERCAALYAEWTRAETRSHVAQSRREGLTPLVRLDGTSDLGLALGPLGDALRASGAETYDYTKSLARAITAQASPHTLVFSHAPRASAETDRALAAGLAVAVAFDTLDRDAFPLSWRGVPVIDGDAADDRSRDRDVHGLGASEAYVVALTWKGRGKANEGGRPLFATPLPDCVLA